MTITNANVAVLSSLACLGFIVMNPLIADENFRPDQSVLPVSAPSDAVVLFGAKANRFVSMGGGDIDWPVRDGALVSTRGQAVPGKSRSNHIVSAYHFRDADIHVEFQLPENSKGNSGLYLHGHYELQILNSFDAKKLTQQEMGALYGFAPPLVNAARKPGEWQVYDVRFRAPRRDKHGNIVEDGHLTAWLNGQKVQGGTKFAEPRSNYHPFRHGRTPYLEGVEKSLRSTMAGPLFLQDHDAEVRFRNVWIRPLDEKAFEYPKKSVEQTTSQSKEADRSFDSLSKTRKINRIITAGDRLTESVRTSSGMYTYAVRDISDNAETPVLARANVRLYYDSGIYCLDCDWKTRRQRLARLLNNGQVVRIGSKNSDFERTVVIARPHTAKIVSFKRDVDPPVCTIENMSPRPRTRSFLKSVMSQAGFGYVSNPFFLHLQMTQLEDLPLEPEAFTFVETDTAAVRIEFAIVNSPMNIVSMDYDEQLKPIRYAIRHPAKGGEYYWMDVEWMEQDGVALPRQISGRRPSGQQTLEYKFTRVAGDVNQPIDPKYFGTKWLNIPTDAVARSVE